MLKISSKKNIFAKIKAIYAQNPFFNFCGFKILDIGYGLATLGLTIVQDKHTNQSHNAHGGLVAAFIDTSLGVVAATMGKRVVTSALNVSLLKGLPEGSEIEVNSKIVSDDGLYMIITSEVYTGEQLVAEGRATMVIVGDYIEIPHHKW